MGADHRNAVLFVRGGFLAVFGGIELGAGRADGEIVSIYRVWIPPVPLPPPLEP